MPSPSQADESSAPGIATTSKSKNQKERSKSIGRESHEQAISLLGHQDILTLKRKRSMNVSSDNDAGRPKAGCQHIVDSSKIKTSLHASVITENVEKDKKSRKDGLDSQESLHLKRMLPSFDVKGKSRAVEPSKGNVAELPEEEIRRSRRRNKKKRKNSVQESVATDRNDLMDEKLKQLRNNNMSALVHSSMDHTGELSYILHLT